MSKSQRELGSSRSDETYCQRIQGGIPARDKLKTSHRDARAFGFFILGKVLREAVGEDGEVLVPVGDRQFSGDALGNGNSGRRNRRHFCRR